VSGTAADSTDTNDPKPDETKPDPKPDNAPADDEKKIPQTKVDEIAGAARNQGRQATLKEVADELGMSLEDAKKFIADKKTEDRSKLEEHERMKVEAQELQEQAAKQMAEAQAATLRANVSSALNRAGEGTASVREDRRDRAIEEAIRLAPGAPDGEDRAAWAATKVRETTPEWFGSSDETDPNDADRRGGTPPAGGSPKPSGDGAKPVDTKSKYQQWKDRNKLRPLGNSST